MIHDYFRTPDDRKVYYHDIATAITTLHPHLTTARVQDQIHALGLTTDFQQGHTASPVPGRNQVPLIWIYFTNWRGERKVYGGQPLRVYFGTNEWHREWTLLMDVLSMTVGMRSIAVKDIHSTFVAGDPEIEKLWFEMVELHKAGVDPERISAIAAELSIPVPR